MTIRNTARLLAVLSVIAMLAACGSTKPKDGPPRSGSGSMSRLPGDAVPRPEAKSRYGNGPNYEVFGKHYTVMPTASGYHERGVASWYGKKFHGNLTSNREVYDMYQMTAAHKTLPLPTYVRVRNLRNNKTIVVRVNDRGPFVHNRIIDLSYAAAMKLDMVGTGTSLVEVEAITFGDPPRNRPQDRPPRQTSTPAPKVVTPAPRPAAPVRSDPNQIFVQIGAFGSRENATRRLALLRSGGIGAAFVLEDTSVQPALFRVRMGPIQGVDQYDMLVEELAKLDINDPIIVTD
ncbi:MAG: septal ring lytic transglycosylase RlpA family protein [Woeseiaceae bacterium]